MKSFSQWCSERELHGGHAGSAAATAAEEEKNAGRLIDTFSELIVGLFDSIQLDAVRASAENTQAAILAYAHEQESVVESRFARELGQIERRLESSLTSALQPLFEDEVVRLAIEDLAQTLRPAVQSMGEGKLRIEAPTALHKQIEAGLARNGLWTEVEESKGSDLIVARIDQFEVEVRLPDWISRLQGLLAR
jgi:hypothetical protein